MRLRDRSEAGRALARRLAGQAAGERLSQTETYRDLVFEGNRLARLLSITDATRVIEARKAGDVAAVRDTRPVGVIP